MPRYPAGTRIGPFRLEGDLSDRGGMASVHEASVIDPNFPERHGKRVALKIARVDDDNSRIFQDLLRKETELLNDLRHPGIVRICPIEQFGRRLFVGRATELPENPFYFAMELLSRVSVDSVLHDDRFNLLWRVELVYQIAIILDYLHLRQAAHRDLKPDNILFRVKPEPRQIPLPVLIDFGLTQKRQLAPEVNAATLTHAAPERVEDLIAEEGYHKTDVKIDHSASDIWALGIMAYELFTGQYPFGEVKTRDELEYLILNEPPLSMPRDVPRELQNVIFKMLHKQPAKRPKIVEVIKGFETQIEMIWPRIG